MESIVLGIVIIGCSVIIAGRLSEIHCAIINQTTTLADLLDEYGDDHGNS